MQLFLSRIDDICEKTSREGVSINVWTDVSMRVTDYMKRIVKREGVPHCDQFA